MAKCSASEIAMVVTHQAIQIHDEISYSKELPVVHHFGVAKALEITKARANLSGSPSPDVNWD
jgi:alkylation response protein AidB-like acyl-CoA dehydrogenase